MTIRKKLGFISILSLVFAIAVGLSLFWAMKQEDALVQKTILANSVAKDVAELNIVTYEYILHHETWASAQWISKYDSLKKLLKSVEFEGQKEEYLLAKVNGCLARIKGVFSRLTSTYERQKNARGDQLSLYQELESRMTGILLSESQQMVNFASRLHGLIQTAMKRVHREMSLLIMVFTVILGGLISVVSYFIGRGLVRSIGKLHKGTEVLGSGNLDFKVGTTAKDEIGQLSRAFDKMTGDLKETTASIVELNKEIDERKQAEDALSAERERLAVTLLSIGDGVIATDVEGTVTLINNMAEELTGWSQEEAVGKDATAILGEFSLEYQDNQEWRVGIMK